MKTINKINVEFLLVIERLYYFAKFILSMKFIFTKNIQNAAWEIINRCSTVSLSLTKIFNKNLKTITETQTMGFDIIAMSQFYFVLFA